MPFALLIAGVIFMVAAVRGNQRDLFELLKDDFSGENNFIYWVMAVVIIVALGNIRAIKPVSDAFLWLVILVIILSNYRNGKDIISSFLEQVRNGTK